MSILSEIGRLADAKTDIIAAIEEMGVDVPDDSKLDALADYIRSISSGPGLNFQVVGGLPVYPDGVVPVEETIATGLTASIYHYIEYWLAGWGWRYSSTSAMDLSNCDSVHITGSTVVSMAWSHAYGMKSNSRVDLLLSDNTAIELASGHGELYTSGSTYTYTVDATIDLSGYSEEQLSSVSVRVGLGDISAGGGATSGLRHDANLTIDAVTAEAMVIGKVDFYPGSTPQLAPVGSVGSYDLSTFTVTIPSHTNQNCNGYILYLPIDLTDINELAITGDFTCGIRYTAIKTWISNIVPTTYAYYYGSSYSECLRYQEFTEGNTVSEYSFDVTDLTGQHYYCIGIYSNPNGGSPTGPATGAIKSIVGYGDVTPAPPVENPIENTIWVNTDEEITGWAFDTSYPDYLGNGGVWISTGLSSSCSFNALKENFLMIRPISAKQWNGSAWVDREVMIYQNGSWNVAIVYYYLNGNDFSNITGGWGGSVTNANGVLSFGATLGSGGATNFYSNKAVDLTNASTLTFVGTVTNAADKVTLTLGVASGSPTGSFAAYSTVDAGATKNEIVVDVSALTGSYYIRGNATAGSFSTSRTYTADFTEISAM